MEIWACSAPSRSRRTATLPTGRPRRTTPRQRSAAAMDPAVGAKRLWVMMEHTTKDGRPKLVRRCGVAVSRAGYRATFSSV